MPINSASIPALRVARAVKRYRRRGYADGRAQTDDWQDREARLGLSLQRAQQQREKDASRTWGDTARDVIGAPGRILGSLTAQPATPEADQQAMMPETFQNPLVKNLTGAVGEAVASGATAPGDALAGGIPQYDETGHTSPEMIRRGFDTAALAGGASVAGTAEGAPALAADSGRAAAPIAAAEHAPVFNTSIEPALEASPRKAATGMQWMNDLKRYGAKPEEMDWRGVTDFLAKKGDQPVTRQEIAEHVGSNSVELRPVDKGAPPKWEDLPGDKQYEFIDRWGMGPRRRSSQPKENLLSQRHRSARRVDQ